MFTRFLFIMTLLLGTATSTAHAFENALFPSQMVEKEVEKMQGALHPSQIYFSDNAIYVSLEGALTQVNAITSDTTGLRLVFPSGTKEWQCPRCGYINHKSAKFCDNCLWDPKKDPIQ